MQTNRSLSYWLIGYGGFLVVIGVIGYLSNPEKAKTALISGGTFGGLSITWGLLLARGQQWARRAALVTSLFLTVVFVWRAAVGWAAVFRGNTDKLVAVTLISLMLAATLVVLPKLLRKQLAPTM